MQRDVDTTKRLDGWKAIAGYFKRDRSTVMRWARDRELPVRRLPGGKQGSVFALEHELAAWALRHADEDEPAGAPSPAAPPAAPSRRRGRWLPTVLVIGGLGATGAAVLAWRDPTPLARPVAAAVSLPADPQAAADFVAARDHWALRTDTDLREAIRLLRRVIGRAPDFAPAHAALADVWLLEREYGSADGQAAFGAAKVAAQRAVALDPQLAAAHRALGFIAYWGENRKDQGMASFRRAIALDDRDGQTHFWFANVLADAGYDEQAQLEYARARLLLPGSTAIEIEHGYSHWLAGRDRQALETLTALAKRYPHNPNLHLCLSWVYIAMGDLGAFVRENALVAKYRNEPRAIAEAAALTAAYARDPAAALALLIRQRRDEADRAASTTRQAPALFASSMGDRDSTEALMTEAVAAGEHWYGNSVRRRIAARWANDAKIQQLIGRLYAPVT
ncbi:tetratricopeptide repeat protein [Sphingomonas sp. KR1UV-12]|uniref:Tetratricopeptide repeat protein n=1 Tax=Sphingomonas aurea TaxID=3063994 RepID=A0ABT9EJJ6_9SPHN|nr:tetratricopeptide repeat protein [Sphingomonas sp. KR1UV-12]MDP1027109.1 tetratricopeptide repeat protein [Sphingomonas sp. KR1UV-12]